MPPEGRSLSEHEHALPDHDHIGQLIPAVEAPHRLAGCPGSLTRLVHEIAVFFVVA